MNLKSLTIQLTLALALLLAPTLADAVEDAPQTPASIGYKLISEVTETGQKISSVAVEYEDVVLASENLKQTFAVKATLGEIEGLADSAVAEGPRNIVAAYTNDKAETTKTPKAGKYVIIELNTGDPNAPTYKIKKEDEIPEPFRQFGENGQIEIKERAQARSVPHFYESKMLYTIEQKGFVKLANGKTVDKNSGTVTGAAENMVNLYIDDFIAGVYSKPENKENQMAYRFYAPKAEEGQKYPLVIFLHGSGQVGKDNIAHIIASKGAVAWPAFEKSFVLAPQCPTVFDAFDEFDEAGKQGGGIHWQSKNRRDMILGMVDLLVSENPAIDTSRIYVQGLSRGSEGALYLLLDRPDFFAGALLMSGREAFTIEWMDGKAAPENLAFIKNVPMWFFHTKEDKVSPVKGSRINVEILKGLGGAPLYTEFTATGADEAAGDNGIVNKSAHNTWDVVYNSPAVKAWLFEQVKK